MLKKIIEALCQPLAFSAVLVVFGLILLVTRRFSGIGRGMIFLGLLVTLLFSYPFVPGLLRSSLVGRYQPVTMEQLGGTFSPTGNVVWIAVLCGGYYTNGAVSVGARLNEASLARFVEGVRVYRQMSHGKILLSVGDLAAGQTQARLAENLAVTVGIPRGDLTLVTGAADTRDEAELMAEIVGKAPFVLVTSDYHMPRAMLLFKALGMRPLPAPAGQCGKMDVDPQYSPGGLFPKAGNLDIADSALHEYLGILWAKIQILCKTWPVRGVTTSTVKR